MPALNVCGKDVLVLIEGGTTSFALTLLFDIVDQITVSGSVGKMSSPSPIGTRITDHIVRNPDMIRISGMIGCLGCDIVRPIPILVSPEQQPQEIPPLLQLVLATLKRASTSQVYEMDYFLVTSNTFIATNMVLSDYNVRHEQSTSQRLMVDLSFEAANVAGEIGAADFKAGGILGF